jgi:hypothetical protein
MRIPAAIYIDEHIPAEKPIGATDLGPIRYFSRQPVVDLLGFVNKDIVNYRKSGGGFGDYLEREDICYLMLFDSHEGVGINYKNEMEMDKDPRFELVKLTSFNIPVEEWVFAIQPIQNYQPAVNIYKIEWINKVDCAVLE